MSSPSPKLIMLAFEGLAWLFPPPPLDDELIPSWEVLQEKGKQWNWTTGWVLLAVIVGCSVLFGYVACTLATNHLAPLGKPLFLIRAEAVELCFWAVFLAMVAAPCLTLLLLRIALGRRLYSEFIMVVSHASAFGGENGVVIHIGKLFWFLLLLIGPLLVAFIALRIDSYTAFTQDAMVVNSMWSLGKKVAHPYQNIRGVYAVAGHHARFEDVANPHHALKFADGTLWTTADGMRAPRPGSDELFIQHIAQQSGHPITPVGFLEDIP